MADPLEEAAQKLEASAKALTDLPALIRAALAQQQAQLHVNRLDTPQAQQMLQARAGLEQQQSLQQLQMQRAQAEAQVRQLRTPQGQALALAVRGERGRLAEAQEEAQRLQAGPAAAAATEAARALSVLKVAATAAAMELGLIMQLGAKASPQAAATLQGSWDLLQARLGSAVLPAMEELSRLAQMLTRALPPDRLRQAGEAYVKYLEHFATPIVGAVKNVGEAFGLGGPTAQSWAGLPAARTGTHEEAYERLQQAALNQDPLQTELMREQLKNLEGILGVLKERPQQTPGAGITVAFR